MTDATSKPQIARAKDRAKADRRANDHIIRTLMGLADGRRWVWIRLGEANIWSSTIRLGEGGYAATAFEEGKRSLGLALLADVTRLCPDFYITMTRENAAVELKDDDNARPNDDE